jgi:ribosomal protein S18 acetylase RimI-like enzyme
MIKGLTWDSEFFNIKIGEWDNDEGDNTVLNRFDLIYVKSPKTITSVIEGFNDNFAETKVVFTKQLKKEAVERHNIRSADNNDDLESLYGLAYESGKFSRFKLDERFGTDNFKKLYRTWIDNSLNKLFADDIVLYIENDIISGLVTYKINNDVATIGLIAVDPIKQGYGIGRKLLNFVEQQLIEQQVFELRIPTQLENRKACSFYAKQGYTILETLYIKHYWKDDTV